jgi:hypothetical protein
MNILNLAQITAIDVLKKRITLNGNKIDKLNKRYSYATKKVSDFIDFTDIPIWKWPNNTIDEKKRKRNYQNKLSRWCRVRWQMIGQIEKLHEDSYQIRLLLQRIQEGEDSMLVLLTQ